MDANVLMGSEGAVELAKMLTCCLGTSIEMYPLSDLSMKALDKPPVPVPCDDGPEEALLSDIEDGGNHLEVVPNDIEENFMFPSIQSDAGHVVPNDEEGLKWEFGGSVETPTSYHSNRKTKFNTRGRKTFTTPLASMLAFFPMELWKLFVLRSNKYASFMKENGEKGSFPPWSRDTDLSEMMMFVSILIEMSLDTHPGRPFDRNWTYTEMTLRRFKELRAAFSVSEKGGEAEQNSKDALFKVRPLLNTLKKTLGIYLDPGTDLAVDESSVACRSMYGRNMIFFNNTKPSGKYHFRFYLLCETDYYNCLRMVVATKTGCDRADGFADPDHEESDVEEDTEEKEDESLDSEDKPFGGKQDYTKTTNLVLDICSNLKNSGRVVNTDNYYTSPQLAIALKEQGIFLRGTCRKSRKMFPKSVTFSKKEAKRVGRGRVKLAVNKEHGLIALGWTDGNAVHFLSSVDGNTMSTVNRRISLERTAVRAPLAIKRYNNGMQGVDRFDQLMSLYSLASRHAFKKWYKKMMMALLDIGLVNAEQHYWMKHKDEKQNDCNRYNFRKKLIQQMRKQDWSIYQGEPSVAPSLETESGLSIDSSLPNPIVLNQANTTTPGTCLGTPSSIDGAGGTANSVSTLGTPLRGSKSTSPECHAIAMSNYAKRQNNGNRSYQGMSCQVCSWEEKGVKTRNVMYCTTHGIRACMGTVPKPAENEDVKSRQRMIGESDPESLGWLCNRREWTCWKKMHDFYLPKGLWTGNVKNPQSFDAKNEPPMRRVLKKSNLYKLKEDWLIEKGVKANRNKKPGRKSTKVALPINDDGSESSPDHTEGSNELIEQPHNEVGLVDGEQSTNSQH